MLKNRTHILYSMLIIGIAAVVGVPSPPASAGVFTGRIARSDSALRPSAGIALASRSIYSQQKLGASRRPLASADTSPPTVPSGLTVARTQTSLTLAWLPSTDNIAVTAYGFYLDGVQVGLTVTTTAVFGGLACGTAHQLQVRAYDAVGNRSIKATISGSTSPCSVAADTQVPTVPSGLGVSSTKNSLTLTWQPSNDNIGVTAYGFYLDGAQAGLTGATTATFGGLACGTSHQLQVRAYDAAGNRSIKATTSGSTTPCAAPAAADSKAPSVPTGLKVSSTKTSLTLTWKRSTDNVAVTAYAFYLDGAQAGLTGAASATFGGLACGTSHQLQVRAYDAAGNRSIKATNSGSTTPCAGPGPGPRSDTKPPTVPSALKVASTKTSLTLTWKRSTDNVGVKAYGLYLDGKQKGATTKIAATFGSLVCNTSHRLQIDAADAAGNRSAKASITARTKACGSTSPPPPAGGAATTFVSPNGSDKNLCTQTAACASFQRAFRATRCGGTVNIAAGTYVQQSLAADASKASCTQRVTLDARGRTVLTRGLKVAAAHVDLLGIGSDFSACVTTGINPSCPSLAITGAGDVVARGVHFSRFHVYAPNVQILGSNFGPSYDNHGIIGAPTRNLLVADTVIHDQWNSQACKSTPGCLGNNHMNCQTINDSSNVVFARTKVYNCQDTALLVKPYRGSNNNIHFENSVFGPVSGTRSISLTVSNYSSSHQNNGIHLLNNTFRGSQGFTVTPGVPYPNSDAIGNLGYLGSCNQIQQAGFALDYNVSPGTACGAHGRGVPSLGLAADGIHLVAGSPAIGAGSASRHPPNDIDGQARPVSGPIDAGADQH